MAIERELTPPEQEAFVQGLERQASDPLITRLVSDEQAELIQRLIRQTGARPAINKVFGEVKSGESTQ